MSFRGLTLREAWRFSRSPLKFAIAMVLKLIAFKGSITRLPTYTGECECDMNSISAIDHESFFLEVHAATELGYTDGRFHTVSESFNPKFVDGYAFVALHVDKKRRIFIGGIRNRTISGISYTLATSGSLSTAESDDIDFVNHRFYLDAPSPSIRIRIDKKGIVALDQAMIAYMKDKDVVAFPGFAEMKHHGDQVSDRVFESRIERGLFVYVQSG